jgi:general secretion pathway protein L
MVPARLRAMLAPQTRRRPVLEIGPAGATLVVPGKGTVKSAHLPILGEPGEQVRQQVQAALRIRSAGSIVTIRLTRALVFETGLDLPSSAERSLPQIVYHQLQRLVPLDLASVRYASQVVARSDDTKSMRVHVVIGRNDAIDNAIDLTQRLALRPDSVIAECDRHSTGVEWTPVLWRATSAGRVGLRHQIWLRGLEIATAVALVVAAGLYTDRLDRQLTLLQEDVARLKRTAAKAAPLVTEVGQVKAELAAIAERLDAPPPLVILAELTRRVPADGWISQLSMRGRIVEASGFSLKATDLISDIEASPLFVNAKFRSPITLSPDGRGDRFDLTFETKSVASR